MVLIYEFGSSQVEPFNDEMYSRDFVGNIYKYDFDYFSNNLDEDSLSSKRAVIVLRDKKVQESNLNGRWRW